MSPSAAAPTLTSDPVPVSARRAQTRERLMAAATTVFAERGVIGASVEEICEAAGFTRGAFYSNFADKDALVLALLQAGAATQYAAAAQAVGEIKDSVGVRSPAELVSQTLTRFEAMGRPTREGVLAQQELMLHAARVPALHGPYQAFLAGSAARLHTLVSAALEDAGLEFVLPFEQALELLVAAHDRAQTRSLFTGAADAGAQQALILTITRPVGPEPAAAAPDGRST